jgi:hypothetical protein
LVSAKNVAHLFARVVMAAFEPVGFEVNVHTTLEIVDVSPKLNGAKYEYVPLAIVVNPFEIELVVNWLSVFGVTALVCIAPLGAAKLAEVSAISTRTKK